MHIDLRQEQPSDYSETESVMREAFWNHYSPGCNEHYLIHILRNCPAFVPELDIVAVLNGRVVGNVVCVKSIIRGDDRNVYEVLSLGPISVLPECQHMGIGGQLIAYTQKLAREMGFHAILLCGDPDYYLRHGFVPAETLGIRTAENKYAAALQVFELHEAALSSAKGRYYADAVYELDQAAAGEFDKSFPAKERVSGTPTQKRFDRLVAMQREAK